MKIAITTDAIYPFTLGGSEIRNYEVAKRLVKKGHEVHIYGAKLWKGKNIIKKDGVTIHGVSNYERLYKKNGKRSSLDPILLALKLYRELSKENFDIIDNLSFTFFNCFSTKLYSMKTKTPLILTWQQFFGDYLKGYFGKLNGNIASTLESYSINLTNNHIAVSNFVKNELIDREVDPDNIKVIYNGTDINLINKIPKQKKIYDLIFVGRLNYQKNIKLLIKSMKLVKQKFPDIKLAIIGDGEDYNKISKLSNKLNLNDNVFFLGKMVDRTQIYKIMKSSKIFVLPSILEGFPLTIIEANACGLPVITTKTKHNNNTEYIEDNINGLNVNSNLIDFSNAIIKLLNNKNLRENMSIHSVNISKDFDWDIITDQQEKYYSNILSKIKYNYNDIRDIPKVIENPKSFFLDQLKIWREEESKDSIYGLNWGDPDKVQMLIDFRERFITPYINPKSVALEIGPGGGRWTRYLLGFKKLYVIDHYQEILDELKKNYNKKNMTFIKNNKTDFPGVPEKSIDYLFTYACFVHLEVETIDKYLKNIKKIVNRNSKICIQYSDNDKELGRNESFTKNNPRIMRKLVLDNGYEIIEEETKLLGHSSVILFKLKNQ